MNSLGPGVDDELGAVWAERERGNVLGFARFECSALVAGSGIHEANLLRGVGKRGKAVVCREGDQAWEPSGVLALEGPSLLPGVHVEASVVVDTTNY